MLLTRVECRPNGNHALRPDKDTVHWRAREVDDPRNRAVVLASGHLKLDAHKCAVAKIGVADKANGANAIATRDGDPLSQARARCRHGRSASRVADAHRHRLREQSEEQCATLGIAEWRL